MVKLIYPLIWSLAILAHGQSVHAAALEILNEAHLLDLKTLAGQPVCSRDCLETEQNAHYSAAASYLNIALETRREVNWLVYRVADGTYTYSYPTVSERSATFSFMPPIAAGVTYLSAGHIHWDNVLNFSPLDWQWVMGNQRDLYLASRDGVLRVLTPLLTRRSRNGQLATPSQAVNLNGRRLKELPRVSGDTRHPEAAGSPNP